MKSKLLMLREFVCSTLIAIIIAMFVVKFIGVKAVVNGDSMYPTLFNGQNLIASKISYIINEPERFDIVVVDDTDNSLDKYLIKRVIALPGESIQIDTEGNIYINDKLLEEKFGYEVIKDPGIAIDKITLADDEYFVLGDNRNGSLDSRSPSVGAVKRNHIIAKAFEIKVFGLDKE